MSGFSVNHGRIYNLFSHAFCSAFGLLTSLACWPNSMTSGRSLTSDATAGATMVETVAGLTIVGCALPSWAERALLLVKTSPLVAEATASAGFILTWFFMFCFTSTRS